MFGKLRAADVKEMDPGTRLHRRILGTDEKIECEIVTGASTKLLRDVETGRKWPIWDYRHMELEA